MPSFASSPSPVMTYPVNSHAGPSSAGRSRNQATNAGGQSLADLYNARHAQQTGGSPPRIASSTSLTALYNQRHEEEKRKGQSSTKPAQPASKSLAELYNQRYETEQQDEDSSFEELSSSRRIAPIFSPSRRHPESGSSNSTISWSRRPISIDSDENAATDDATLARSGDAEPETDTEEEEDELEVRATPISRSPTRSESVIPLPDRPEVVFVYRPSIPRRGALGSARSLLTIDSENDEDRSPAVELPSASASSAAALSFPHPPPRKLVVDSNTSSAPRSESDSSVPPAPPHHRRTSIPQRIVESTQEEDSMTSMLRIDSAASHQTSTSGNEAASEAESEASDEPMSNHPRIGSPDEAVVISDSSIRTVPSMPTPPPLSESGTLQRQAAIISESDDWPATDGEAVVLLDTPTRPIRETLAEERGSSLSADELAPPSPAEDRAALQGDDRRSSADPDSLVITEARIAPGRRLDSSAAATPGDASDSDALRRYPKRARTVKDYNLVHLFEESILRAYHDEAAAQPQHKPRKEKEEVPVVEASPAFFEALRAPKSRRGAGKELTFHDFLMSKAKLVNDEATPSSPGVPATRSTVAPNAGALTEAQARELPSRPYHPAALWGLTISTEDRGELFKLKSSTRRWLGMPGPNDRPDLDPEDSRSSTPPPFQSRSSRPVNLSGCHLGQTPSTAELREALESLEGAGPFGRAPDAAGLESDARRIRLGRAYKMPLPASLRIVAEMEQKEWLRLDESLPEIARMAEEERARELGQLFVEVDDSEWIKTQVDAAGRKRVSTLRCETGGTLRVYYRHEEEQVATPVQKIVRIRSPTKSPSRTRLGSVALPREDMEVEVVGAETSTSKGKGKQVEKSRQRSESPRPVIVLDIRTSSPPPPTEDEARKPRLQEAMRAPGHSRSISISSKSKHSPANLSTSKPRPSSSSSGSNSKRDLLSYFSQSTTAPKSASSASSKGKGRAVDGPRFHEDHDDDGGGSGGHVFIDLTHSSSTSASEGRRERLSSPPAPLAASSRSAGEGKKATVESRLSDPFLRAASRKEAQREVVASVEIPSLGGNSKRKRPHRSAEEEDERSSDSHIPAPPVARQSTAGKVRAMLPPFPVGGASTFTSPTRKSPAASSSRLPQPTPSPSRGGWQGISSWYNTRDAFTPTPDDRPRKQAEREREREKAKRKLKGKEREREREKRM